jgi:hypothetical protein
MAADLAVTIAKVIDTRLDLVPDRATPLPLLKSGQTPFV